MHDEAPRSPDTEMPPRGRRAALRVLALALALPALAACKEVQPGSGVQTIRRSRERSPPGGR